MEKNLQERIMENFDKRNIENVRKLIEEPMVERMGMFVNESGNGQEVKISEESRKICAESLIK